MKRREAMLGLLTIVTAMTTQAGAQATAPAVSPTRYELVLNRKAAAAFGITIPSAVLLRADRVID